MNPETFKSVRKRLGLSQKEFGALLGIRSQHTMSSLETGKYPISDGLARAVAWLAVFGTGDPWDEQSGFAALNLRKETRK